MELKLKEGEITRVWRKQELVDVSLMQKRDDGSTVILTSPARGAGVNEHVISHDSFLLNSENTSDAVQFIDSEKKIAAVVGFTEAVLNSDDTISLGARKSDGAAFIPFTIVSQKDFESDFTMEKPSFSLEAVMAQLEYRNDAALEKRELAKQAELERERELDGTFLMPH